MRDASLTPSFTEALLEWAVAWRPANHSVETRRGSLDRRRASAWVQAVGPSTGGQVTVWETGDCEIEVYDAATLRPRWLEHFDFATTSELMDALGRFAAILDDPPPDDIAAR